MPVEVRLIEPRMQGKLPITPVSPVNKSINKKVTSTGPSAMNNSQNQVADGSQLSSQPVPHCSQFSAETGGDGVDVQVDSSEDEYLDEEPSQSSARNDKTEGDYSSEASFSSLEEGSMQNVSFSYSDSEFKGGPLCKEVSGGKKSKNNKSKRGRSPFCERKRCRDSSSSDSDSDYQEMINDPKVRKFFKYMVKETMSEENQTELRGKATSSKGAKLNDKCGTRVRPEVAKIKSPSDTTIYVPALNRQQPVNENEMNVVNQISQFVE